MNDATAVRDEDIHESELCERCGLVQWEEKLAERATDDPNLIKRVCGTCLRAVMAGAPMVLPPGAITEPAGAQ